jgi:Predicted acyltransferases
MVVAGLMFGAVSAFPGWIAFLPVAGALLVIGAGQPRGALSLQPIAELPPVQRVGDWSYAIYLWHWPILILLPLAVGDIARSNAGKVAIVAVTVALAWLTREYVEKPFIRLGGRSPHAGAPRRLESRTLLGALAGMVAVALVAVPPLTAVSVDAAGQRQALERAQAGDPTCFGAASVGVPACPADTTAQVVPGALIAGADQSALSACQVAPHAPAHHCEFGPEDGIPVALVGDSHASQWLVAVEAAANALDWRVTTYLAGACPLFLPQPGLPHSTTRGCEMWQERTLSQLVQQQYVYVLVSAQPWDALDRPSGAAGSPQFGEFSAHVGEEYAAAWEVLTAAGSEVIVIADSPSPALAGRGDIPSCIERSGAAACAVPRAPALASTEPLRIAAQLASDVHMVDVNDRICPGVGDCAPVVGGVLVWADASHLTKTYVGTLAPEFIGRLAAIVDGRAVAR